MKQKQQILNASETGRSMVEMLGVLAIIGVLSVAGVQGYTIAMNKHRANEILNEASKRAIVVASQIASGRTPTLTEFTDNEVGGAEFAQQVQNASGSAWTASDSQFRIGYVSGKEPSEAVQKQMENIAGTNGMIQGFNGGLTYNNDLGEGSGGSETPEQQRQNALKNAVLNGCEYDDCPEGFDMIHGMVGNLTGWAYCSGNGGHSGHGNCSEALAQEIEDILHANGSTKNCRTDQDPLGLILIFCGNYY